MADYGAKFADRKIRKVDRQLQAVYRQAEKELKETLADFVRKNKAQNEYKLKQLQAGLITEEEYQSWLKGQAFQKKRWENKIKSVQKIMHSHNVQAAKIVHENKIDVYNENYLYQQYEMEMITGMSFDIYSEQAVAKLIKDREKLLPEWKIDEKKDYRWNYRKLNTAITQGIIQGESVEKIMERLTKDLWSQNEAKMRMFARTAITGAQNAGHQQQMEDAERNLGIKQVKQWVATLDMRTRDAHRRLDGQEVPYNQPFNSQLGKIRFPGDPEAEPANVYNCRCDMITIYPEYRTKQDNWRDSETIDGLTYKKWKENNKLSARLSAPRSKNEHILETNEELAVADLAEMYNIEGDPNDMGVSLDVANAVIDNSLLQIPTASQWNGVLHVSDERILGNDGLFDPTTKEITMYKNAEFATKIHELLHSRSKGFTQKTYAMFGNIEEACVETITQKIIAGLDVRKRVAYPKLVRNLRLISELTDQTPDEFAIGLFNLPLEKRYDMLKKTVEAYKAKNKVGSKESSLLNASLRVFEGVKK